MTSSAMVLKTIVIADDTASVQDRFVAALHDAGHRAIGVKSAPELLSRVRAALDRIDLVVLDLQLPQSTGWTSYGPSANLTRAGSRFSSSADQFRAQRKFVSWRTWGSPAMSMNTAPSNTSSPRSLPTCSQTTSTDARAPAWCSASPSPITPAIPSSLRSRLTSAGGGVGVRTMNPLDPGTQVRGRFRLPGAERDIEVTSRVVWSDRRVGIGPAVRASRLG